MEIDIRENNSITLLSNDSITNSTPKMADLITQKPIPPSPVEVIHLCQWILFQETDAKTKFRYWDLMILVPNLIFLLFLFVKFKRTCVKLRRLNSPIITTFYILVCMNVATSIIRCIISMRVNASEIIYGKVDQIFWVLVRFFLLLTEISVPVFALFFGHLESRQAIQKVLIITSTLALIYSVCQGSIELIAPDEKFYIREKQFHLFAHGGMIFWMITCTIFSFAYFFIFLLPWSPWSHWFNLPEKSSFYIYALFLCILNVLQAIGSGLYYSTFISGLCIIDVTTYLYFTLFTPFIYWTFLASFFSKSKSVMLFSYTSHLNDGNDDVTTVEATETPEASILASSNTNFPQQLSISSIHTLDFVYHEPNDEGDTTQVRRSPSNNQLRPTMKQFYRSKINSLSNQNTSSRK